MPETCHVTGHLRTGTGNGVVGYMAVALVDKKGKKEASRDEGRKKRPPDSAVPKRRRK